MKARWIDYYWPVSDMISYLLRRANTNESLPEDGPYIQTLMSTSVKEKQRIK